MMDRVRLKVSKCKRKVLAPDPQNPKSNLSNFKTETGFQWEELGTS
jgi:hypothetical protein